jgi:hypothetical protein
LSGRLVRAARHGKVTERRTLNIACQLRSISERSKSLVAVSPQKFRLITGKIIRREPILVTQAQALAGLGPAG